MWWQQSKRMLASSQVMFFVCFWYRCEVTDNRFLDSGSVHFNLPEALSQERNKAQMFNHRILEQRQNVPDFFFLRKFLRLFFFFIMFLLFLISGKERRTTLPKVHIYLSRQLAFLLPFLFFKD